MHETPSFEILPTCFLPKNISYPTPVHQILPDRPCPIKYYPLHLSPFKYYSPDLSSKSITHLISTQKFYPSYLNPKILSIQLRFIKYNPTDHVLQNIIHPISPQNITDQGNSSKNITHPFSPQKYYLSDCKPKIIPT